MKICSKSRRATACPRHPEKIINIATPHLLRGWMPRTSRGTSKFQDFFGFTLVELIIVLTFVSSVLLLAVPVSQHLITENRIVNDVNRLLSALYLARSEAVRSGEVITFCKSINKKNCGGQWSDGQIIMNASGKVLHVYPQLSPLVELNWRGSFGFDDAIKFLPTGFAAQQGSFDYRSSQSDKLYVRRIVINHAGRFRVSS